MLLYQIIAVFCYWVKTLERLHTCWLRWGRTLTIVLRFERIEQKWYLGHCFLMLESTLSMLWFDKHLVACSWRWLWCVHIRKMSAIVMLSERYASRRRRFAFLSAFMPFWGIKILACTCFIMAFGRMKLAFSWLNFIIKPASKTFAEVQLLKKWGPKIALNRNNCNFLGYWGFRV